MPNDPENELAAARARIAELEEELLASGDLPEEERRRAVAQAADLIVERATLVEDLHYLGLEIEPGSPSNEIIITAVRRALERARAGDVGRDFGPPPPANLPDPWEFEDEREAIVHEPRSVWTWIRRPEV
jgi:hypothetical protein